MKGIDLSEDVYETISDDEFAFDDFEDELALPKPASVMEVDWSLLASLSKAPANKGILIYTKLLRPLLRYVILSPRYFITVHITFLRCIDRLSTYRPGAYRANKPPWS